MNYRQNISVAGVPYGAFISHCAENYPHGCPKPGLDLQLLITVLAPVFNVTKIGLFSTQEEEEDAIIRGKYDVTSLTSALQLNIDHSIEHVFTDLGTNEIALVVNRPRRQRVPVFLIFGICSRYVWVLFMCAFIIIRFLKLLAEKLNCKSSYRVGYIIWALMLCILFETCGNFLSIVLSKPPEIDMPFASVHDLVYQLKHNVCRLIITDDILNELTKYSLKSTELAALVSATHLYSNMKVLPGGDDLPVIREIASSSLRVCSAGVIWSTSLLMASQYCNVQKVISYNSSMLNNSTYHYLFIRKDNPKAESIRRALTHLTAADSLKEDLLKKYQNSTTCEEKKILSKPTVSPLKISQLLDCFYLLGTGSVLAAVTGMLEYVRAYKKGKYRPNCFLSRTEKMEKEIRQQLLCCSADTLDTFSSLDRNSQIRILKQICIAKQPACRRRISLKCLTPHK